MSRANLFVHSHPRPQLVEPLRTTALPSHRTTPFSPESAFLNRWCANPTSASLRKRCQEKSYSLGLSVVTGVLRFELDADRFQRRHGDGPPPLLWPHWGRPHSVATTHGAQGMPGSTSHTAWPASSLCFCGPFPVGPSVGSPCGRPPSMRKPTCSDGFHTQVVPGLKVDRISIHLDFRNLRHATRFLPPGAYSR